MMIIGRMPRRDALAIFNKAFPEDIVVFVFDNSSGHACMAKIVKQSIVLRGEYGEI
jgi:hypothetical protein